jgi:purine-binding chemotaxis protein CheW
MSELVLIVRLAGERVALRAAEIESVVEIEAVTPAPGAAPHVVGVAALRSRVVTVIDGAASLRGGGVTTIRDAAVAVIDGHAYALLVDSVEDVVAADGDPRPLPGSVGGDWSRIARASVAAEGDLLLLVDIAALIAGPAAQAA